MNRLRRCPVGGATGVPIDREYLEKQVPELKGTERHTEYYLKAASSRAIDPTRFFITDWYAWQNPDWADQFANPYLHYLDKGAKEGRDPSPFVDVARYLDVTGGAIPRSGVYAALLSGLRSPTLGVYESEADLIACQSGFLSGISLYAHRMTLPRSTRPALVVCQAGKGAKQGCWAKAETRNWDLMLNYYDAQGMRPGLGEYALFKRGQNLPA